MDRFLAMQRRQLLARACAAAALSLPARASARGKNAPRILLRPGSYQRGNIGDISHSLGALRLFELHFPEAEILLWPRGVSDEARANLITSFPRLRIVEGDLDTSGKPTTSELAAAWKEADLLLHGSAPGFKGMSYMPAWRAGGRRPYGVFGMTDDPRVGKGRRDEGGTLSELAAALGELPADSFSADKLEVLNGASFLFCRETLTQKHYQRQGVTCPVLEFGPDATFALHLRDDDRATAFLKKHDLKEGEFICVIPRLRYTPEALPEGARLSTNARAKHAINERTMEPDHAKLRGLICEWVRHTGLKALVCPEMTYQLELSKRLLVDPLPEDVKPRVVWRDHYWLPDEAASVYQRSVAVVSFECHSPIIALATGTPAIYVRQPTDTIKGQMYHDIGVSGWTGEVDEVDASDLWRRVRRIHQDNESAKKQVRDVMLGVRRVQQRMVEAVKAALT